LKRLSFGAALLLAAFAGAPAAATSGWGCYQPNVVHPETLNVRAGPSAGSAAVAELEARDAPGAAGAIIALRGAEGLRGEDRQPSLFEIHQAEHEICEPAALPLGARWCPVAIYAGQDPVEGWIKRRFVDHSECP
jgi:hypothetical protein